MSRRILSLLPCVTIEVTHLLHTLPPPLNHFQLIVVSCCKFCCLGNKSSPFLWGSNPLSVCWPFQGRDAPSPTLDQSQMHPHLRSIQHVGKGKWGSAVQMHPRLRLIQHVGKGETGLNDNRHHRPLSHVLEKGIQHLGKGKRGHKKCHYCQTCAWY